MGDFLGGPQHRCPSEAEAGFLGVAAQPPGFRLPRPCTALGPARSPQPACPLSGAGVVGVCLGGYLTETAGSWTPVFNLVAVVSSLGLGAFLVFGEAQRVDLSPARQDL